MTRNIHQCTKLKQITLCNLLSFGPSIESIELENLNILIGPNGAGKSNLIEAVALMRAAPGDIRSIVRRGGGAGEWIWKGGKGVAASIDFVFDNPQGRQPLRHVLSFREDAMGFRLEDERIENETADKDEKDPYFFYRFNEGHPMVNTIKEKERFLAHETVDAERSIRPNDATRNGTRNLATWQKYTKKSASTGNGPSGAMPYSANPRKRICAMIGWRKISRTSGCF